MATDDHPEPKQLDGLVEAARYIHAARRSAVKARTATRVQIKSLLVTGPEQIRARYRSAADTALFPVLARTRPASEENMLTRTIMSSLKSLARRYQHLTAEIDVLEAELEQLVFQINPGLAQTKGIGTVTAAQLLIRSRPAWSGRYCSRAGQAHRAADGCADGCSCPSRSESAGADSDC